jgi:hypothetical protein
MSTPIENNTEELRNILQQVNELPDAGGSGEDGFSPIATVTQTEDGAVISITDKDGTTTATITNGRDGENGVGGYTPVKGVDYYTEADKAEWEAFISDELAKRGQLKPEFAKSIDECTDTTKLYVLPDGYIYAYIYRENSGPAYTNLADPTSADWLTGKRFSTSSISDASGGIITNYIPAKNGDTVHVRGLNLLTTLGGSTVRIRLYNGSTVADDGAATVLHLKNNGLATVDGDTTTFTMNTVDGADSFRFTFDSLLIRP